MLTAWLSLVGIEGCQIDSFQCLQWQAVSMVGFSFKGCLGQLTVVTSRCYKSGGSFRKLNMIVMLTAWLSLEALKAVIFTAFSAIQWQSRWQHGEISVQGGVWGNFQFQFQRVFVETDSNDICTFEIEMLLCYRKVNMIVIWIAWVSFWASKAVK